MRKIIVLVLLVTLFAGGLWAEGNREGTGEQKLKVLWSGRQVLPKGFVFEVGDIAKGLLAQTYPGVAVEYVLVDMSSGADKTMRAMVAAGIPPDLYIDTWVRSASYLRPDFALDLRGYMDDLADYVSGALGGVTRDGAVLGLPLPGDGQAMAVNLAICREVGFVPKDWQTWTIDDFLRLAELVKAKYGGQRWVTGLFAGNQSGDYLIRSWAASFGGEFYSGGDYSKTEMNTPAGKATLDFFVALTKRGYVRADWMTQVDDDYVIDWASGKLAAAPFFFGWIEPYFKTIEDGGGKRFDYAFVPFPRAPGVSRVGAFYTGTGLIVHKSTEELRNKVAAKYAQAYNSPEAQLQQWAVGNLRPNRLSVAAAIGKPEQFAQVTAVIATNGLYDLGDTSPLYQATRPLFPQMLQKLAKGGDSGQLLHEYAVAVDRVLSGK